MQELTCGSVLVQLWRKPRRLQTSSVWRLDSSPLSSLKDAVRFVELGAERDQGLDDLQSCCGPQRLGQRRHGVAQAGQGARLPAGELRLAQHLPRRLWHRKLGLGKLRVRLLEGGGPPLRPVAPLPADLLWLGLLVPLQVPMTCEPPNEGAVLLFGCEPVAVSRIALRLQPQGTGTTATSFFTLRRQDADGMVAVAAEEVHAPVWEDLDRAAGGGEVAALEPLDGLVHRFSTARGLLGLRLGEPTDAGAKSLRLWVCPEETSADRSELCPQAVDLRLQRLRAPLRDGAARGRQRHNVSHGARADALDGLREAEGGERLLVTGTAGAQRDEDLSPGVAREGVLQQEREFGVPEWNRAVAATLGNLGQPRDDEAQGRQGDVDVYTLLHASALASCTLLSLRTGKVDHMDLRAGGALTASALHPELDEHV
mmetsp:Transcript_22952/g.72031  ORF Transcript_22952/g.72031 Transcript_22952/m.72031 type:complete len:427 (-) Transcript_22952:83-1363(-)